MLALLLGPGSGLNIVQYNTVLASTYYVKITVPNTVVGSIVCVKNVVLVSIVRSINQYLLS